MHATSPHWKMLEQLGAHQPASRDPSTVHEPSSPPCQMTNTDPAYHGFYRNDEIVPHLNTLLAAERAGALVCAQTLQQLPPGHAARGLLQDIQRDEIKSCRGLLRSLQLLQGQATTQIGDFHKKAMAINDLDERLQFLQRGQTWVLRQLDVLLPRVMQTEVFLQLQIMRKDHATPVAQRLQKSQASD